MTINPCITCVKAFAFQSPNKGPFKAQYKRQSLLFEIWFNKLLWGKNYLSATKGARGSAGVSKWLEDHPLRYLFQSFNLKDERVLFHPLSLRFMKKNACFGCCCAGFVGLFCPKGALGSQKSLGKKSGVSEEIWQFLKKFCETTLSNLLSAKQVFLKLATRWRS